MNGPNKIRRLSRVGTDSTTADRPKDTEHFFLFHHFKVAFTSVFRFSLQKKIDSAPARSILCCTVFLLRSVTHLC